LRSSIVELRICRPLRGTKVKGLQHLLSLRLGISVFRSRGSRESVHQGSWVGLEEVHHLVPLRITTSSGLRWQPLLSFLSLGSDRWPPAHEPLSGLFALLQANELFDPSGVNEAFLKVLAPVVY